jgi:hypothetical protein
VRGGGRFDCLAAVCRIPLDGAVPHPTTLMKLTTRCGSAAVDGLNEALLAKAAQAKLLRTGRIRVDTTVVAANVAYPTDLGLLARAVRRIGATGKLMGPAMPTGALLSDEHLDAITEPVIRHGAWVIYDATMERIRFDDQNPCTRQATLA